MDPRREAEVEAERLHDPEGRAGGKDIGGGKYARVLLDHRRGGGISARVQVTPHPRPGVLAVLLEVRCRIERRQRLPDAVGDVGHILLMQNHVVARAEPAEVAADEMLPWVGERFLRRRHVPNYVLGEIADVDGRPARVHDVDEHQRVVIGQVDVDVVGRVVGSLPGELDTTAADVERALILEDFLGRRPRLVVVAYQELSRLLMPDARDVLAEQRRRATMIRVMVRVDEILHLVADAVGGGDLVYRALNVVADRRRCVEYHYAILGGHKRRLISGDGNPVEILLYASDVVALCVEGRTKR